MNSLRTNTLVLSHVAKKKTPGIQKPLFRAFSSLINEASVLKDLGLESSLNDPISGVFDGESWTANGSVRASINPSTGKPIGYVQFGNADDYERCIYNVHAAKREWSSVPAPKRGDIVRQIGNALREKQHSLGALLSLEMGKIYPEGVGEVQEFIDMCDLAAGMSRQIPGQILPSERTEHVLLETWSPLGVTGIITAFNFPNAVAGWNSSVSLVCGNTQILKGAESASLTSIAIQKIFNDVFQSNGLGSITSLCQGTGEEVGERLIHDERVDLVSFTGSTAVGRHVQEVVGNRFGRSLLELGGNNAIVVMKDSDMEMALRSVLFAAVGTCGQRCTSLRRLLLHSSIHDDFLEKLAEKYEKVRIGDPTDEATLVGPLHTQAQVEQYVGVVERATGEGGKVVVGGDIVDPATLPEHLKEGNYVMPTIISISHDAPIVQEENFVPIMYVSKFETLEEAIEINNSVDQGLSSALFSKDMRDVFKWIGPNGSDTGIVNVNTSCSGAEIGGAFGGNKHTGGGRESGSDAWKQYMRRGTCTVNFGNDLPLAQGIDFS
mmetsp:Transcript_6981/g.7982  ORF Transcript_6981/g.7982 Transcript_6981/m.7982 type:complete len:550 (+) Transcript_6981:151-1800(+)